MPVVENLKIIAKKLLEKDGFLSPVIFLIKNDQLMIEPIPMEAIDKIMGATEDSKARSAFVAGLMAKDFGADKIILIWDAAFRTVDKLSEPYDETEAPLTYPKSLRTECIILNEIEVPSGKDNTIVIPYKGGDGEPVEFLPDNLPEDAKFESRFTEIALRGYNKIKE
jgi:hypothetical protein